MNCFHCQTENGEADAFCVSCGSSLPQTDELSLSDLAKHVLFLRREIQNIRDALSSSGIHVSSATSQEGLHDRSGGTEFSQVHDPGRTPAASGRSGNIYSGASGVFRHLPGPDWESLIGGNWLARVGVLSIVIGVGFFLKLAFDNNWVNETGIAVLGLLGGLVFLAAGEFWKGRYPSYAQALLGGGVGILYLTIFAAFALYELINFLPAVSLLLITSVMSACLALRHGSMALAIIGILGAFSAPFISLYASGEANTSLSENIPSSAFIAYIITVDIGVLILSTLRNWRWFTLLALAGSLTAYGAWYDVYGDTATLITSQGGITIIFLSLVAGTTLFHFIWRRTPQVFDYSLMILNATSYFLISYELMADELVHWIGAFTFVLALFYGGLAYLSFVRNKDAPYLALMLSGIAIVFLAIAIPVQFDGPWISIGWSVQAVTLVWLASRLEMAEVRAIAAGIFGTLIVSLLVYDSQVDLEGFNPIINTRILAFAAGVASLYLSAYFLQRDLSANRDEVVAPGRLSLDGPFNQARGLLEPRVLFPVVLILANFLTIWVLSAEIISTVDSDIVKASQATEDHIKSLSLSLLWAGYAGIVLIVGTFGRWPRVRMAGLGLMGIPILKLFLVDTFQLEQEYRVAAYLSLGGILVAGGFLYQRYGAQIREFLSEE